MKLEYDDVPWQKTMSPSNDLKELAAWLREKAARMNTDGEILRYAHQREALRKEAKQVVRWAEAVEGAMKDADMLRSTVAGLRKGVPYREFCSHPDKCAGLLCCQRDPVCCD